MKTSLFACRLALALFVAATVPVCAEAQVLWSALQTKPKPNMVIGVDTSVTMQINPECQGCHLSWGAKPAGLVFDQLPAYFTQALKLAQKQHAEKMRQIREQEQSISPQNQQLTPTKVSLVLPVQASSVISGTVMTEKQHPERFKSTPGLQVVDLGQVDLPTSNDGTPNLGNLTVNTGNGVWQPANLPILFRPHPLPPEMSDQVKNANAPSGGSATHYVNFQSAHAGFTADDNSKMNATPSRIALLETSPVSLADEIGHVRGPGRFSGDINKLLVSFADQPMTPIAASQDGFFYELPAGAKPGPNQLVFADQGPHGWFAASAQVAVLQLTTSIDQPALLKGQRTNGHVGLNAGALGSSFPGYSAPTETVGGGSGYFKNPDAPDAPPRGLNTQYAGNMFYDPDLINPADLEKQVPDFHAPEAGKQGFIFLAIQNQSLNVISIGGFKGANRSWYLRAKELPFNTTLPIQSRSGGGFNISVIAKAFFPAVACREYQLPDVARTDPVHP